MNGARKRKDNIFNGLLYGSAFVTVAMLFVIVGYIFYKGFGNINFNFIFIDYQALGDVVVYPIILETVYSVVIAIWLSAQIVILAAIYIQEYAKQGRLV